MLREKYVTPFRSLDIIPSLSLMSFCDETVTNWLEAGDFGISGDSMAVGSRITRAKTIGETIKYDVPRIPPAQRAHGRGDSGRVDSVHRFL
jgi:hypothetical protein